LRSFAKASGSGQDKQGPRGESWTNDGAKQNMEKGKEEVAREQDETQGEKT
jgi:hypothetical protein